MRLAIFSAWNSSSRNSRRSIARSALQSFAALSALVVLTGAKGQGCGGTVILEPTPPLECDPGTHQETVCSPCEVGDMCEEQCVPDSVCGEGFHEEWVCPGEPTPVPFPTDPGAPSTDTSGTSPSEPCSLVCVPDSICPPGTVEQTVCSGSTVASTSSSGGGWGGAGGGWEDDPSPMPPPPPDACWTECVPAPVCPPGTVEQTVCGGSTTASTGTGWGAGGAGPGTGAGGADPGTGGAGGAWDDGPTPVPPPPPDGCWTECVPFPQPVCPPGTVEQTVCSEGESSSVSTGTSGAGGAYPGTGGAGAGGAGGDGGPFPDDPWCWTECVPVPEPVCPPGTVEHWTCEEGSSTSSTTGSGGAGGFEGPYPDEPSSCWVECLPDTP